MRQITYICDCCKKEISKEESEMPGQHPIFNDYSNAAVYGRYACQECRPKLNKAAQDCIDECSKQ